MKRSRELTPVRYWAVTLAGPPILMGIYWILGDQPIHPLSALAALILFLPVGWFLCRLNQQGKLNRILGFSPTGFLILFILLYALVDTVAPNAGPWLRGWFLFPEFLLWSLVLLADSHHRRQKEAAQLPPLDPPSP